MAERGQPSSGVCEVENSHVLELLVVALGSVGRNYDVIHEDTSDSRGIDVAFIYDQDGLPGRGG